jgi:hypothetical protein
VKNDTSTTPSSDDDIPNIDPAELINETDDIYMKAFMDT